MAIKGAASSTAKLIPIKVSERLATIPSYIEKPFLSPDETASRIEYWNKRAVEGNFDPDIHIVDPLAYYSNLDYLEREIVVNSEFFRCGGKYNLNDHDYTHDILKEVQASMIEEGVWPVLFKSLIVSRASSDPVGRIPGGLPSSSSTPVGTSGFMTDQLDPLALSLKKTFMLLCHIRVGIEVLRNARFCTTFISMLVERGGGITELTKILELILYQLCTGILLALSEICSTRKSSEEI